MLHSQVTRLGQSPYLLNGGVSSENNNNQHEKIANQIENES